MSARPPLSVINGTPRVQVLGPVAMARVRAGIAPAVMPAAAPSPEPPVSALSRNVETLVNDAYAHGEAQGERWGYISGFRWGWICGALAGLLGGALVVVVLGRLA